MATQKINYKSDFTLAVTFTLAGEQFTNPTWDFALGFKTLPNGATYVCSRRGGDYVNCRLVEGQIQCIFERHGLQPGRLQCEFVDIIPDSTFAGGVRRVYTPTFTAVELVRGAAEYDDVTAEVVLDIEGALEYVRQTAMWLHATLDESEEDGFFYTDKDGYVAMHYTPTDGFDAARISRNFRDEILSELVGEDDGFYYTDKDGYIAMNYTPAQGFDAARVSEHFKGLIIGDFYALEDGLYYTDREGYVALSYTPADGLDCAKLSDHFVSLIGTVVIPDRYEDYGTEEYIVPA